MKINQLGKKVKGLAAPGLILVSIVLCGCERPSPQSQGPTLIRASIGRSPQTLDWNLYSDAQSGFLLTNIMSGLFTVDQNSTTLQTKTDLTQSHRRSFDFKNWSFCLKKTKWSDGTPLLPQHFIDSWKRVLTSKNASPHASDLFIIKGAEDFYNGKHGFEKVDLRIQGERCFSVELNKPYPELPLLLSSPFTFPIRKDLIQKFGREWWLPQNIVTLGPYKVVGGDLRESLTLQPLSESSTTHPIELVWIENEKTALQLFKQGQLSWVKLSASELTMDEKLKASIITHLGVGITFAAFNLKNKKMKNKVLREQIAEVIKRVNFPLEQSLQLSPSRTLIPWPIIEGHPLTQEDRPSATQEKEMKIPDNLEILSGQGRLKQAYLESLAYTLKKEKSVNVKINLQNSSTLFDSLKNSKDHALYLLTWTPAQPTVAGYLKLFAGSFALNFSGWNSESFNKELRDFENQMDQTQQLKSAMKLEKILIDKEFIVIPLYRSTQYFLVKQGLTFTPHVSERIDFSQIR